MGLATAAPNQSEVNPYADGTLVGCKTTIELKQKMIDKDV